jgi:hypothetical protein
VPHRDPRASAPEHPAHPRDGDVEVVRRDRGEAEPHERRVVLARRGARREQDARLETVSGVDASGNFTLTPSKAGYWFSPPSLSPTVNGADVTSQDFAAILRTYRIEGNVEVGVAGPATLRLSSPSTWRKS